MIELAHAKRDGRIPARFIVGDMLALPFPGHSFDAVTVGYGVTSATNFAVSRSHTFETTPRRTSTSTGRRMSPPQKHTIWSCTR